jgi:hypothetical protein
MLENKIEIIDNFLPLEDFKDIQKEIMSPYFPWYLNLNVLYPDNKFDITDHLYNYQLVHTFYRDWGPYSNYMSVVDKLVRKINPIAILRIKANLNPVTEKRIVHGMHIDVLHPCTTGIFYINTNNGVTVFEDGTEVESVENRFLNFSSNLAHSGSTCTDKKARFIININYI